MLQQQTDTLSECRVMLKVKLISSGMNRSVDKGMHANRTSICSDFYWDEAVQCGWKKKMESNNLTPLDSLEDTPLTTKQNKTEMQLSCLALNFQPTNLPNSDFCYIFGSQRKEGKTLTSCISWLPETSSPCRERTLPSGVAKQTFQIKAVAPPASGSVVDVAPSADSTAAALGFYFFPRGAGVRP